MTSKEHTLDDVPMMTSHNEESFSQRHAEVTESVIVATGKLVEDDSLKPNEVTARTFIFYVPQNEYDYLDLATIIPTIAKRDALDLERKLNNQTGQLEPTWHRLGGRGAQGKPMNRDEAST